MIAAALSEALLVCSGDQGWFVPSTAAALLAPSLRETSQWACTHTSALLGVKKSTFERFEHQAVSQDC
jgi:hypothetical protein